MIKGKMLNSNILYTVSKMGHTDQLVIADAGLPIPESVERIDISLTRGIPAFRDVVEAVGSIMEIEKIVLAEEIQTNNSVMLKWLNEKFEDLPIEFVDHESFKIMTNRSKAVIRTGECTPYSNVILQSGVDFSGE